MVKKSVIVDQVLILMCKSYAIWLEHAYINRRLHICNTVIMVNQSPNEIVRHTIRSTQG